MSAASKSSGLVKQPSIFHVPASMLFEGPDTSPLSLNFAVPLRHVPWVCRQCKQGHLPSLYFVQGTSPCTDSVPTYSSLQLRHALALLDENESRNPTRKDSLRFSCACCSSHHLRNLYRFREPRVTSYGSQATSHGSRISNRNTAANRIHRNSLIQKEKTFSNRNKNACFHSVLASCPASAFLFESSIRSDRRSSQNQSQHRINRIARKSFKTKDRPPIQSQHFQGFLRTHGGFHHSPLTNHPLRPARQSAKISRTKGYS